jgi:threonine/homoserine/homoserine lactone efflux protein
MPVGAISALLISLSARAGLRVGTAAAMGVATADFLYAATAVLGGAALAPVIAPLGGALRWVAAVVLVALAARTATQAIRQHRSSAPDRRRDGFGTPGRAYVGLLGLTLLNPTTIVYFGALVLGRQATAPLTPVGQVVFVVAAFVASASWQLLVAGGGSLVGRVLAGPRARLATALVSSGVIVALAVLTVAH